jgi:predicted nucleotide-binding protein
LLGQVGPNTFETITNGVNKLLSFRERLQFATEPLNEGLLPAAGSSPETGDLVIFLVHGRNHGVRETVARFLERTGPDELRPVILDELANKGRTLVEKLEQHAGDSKYAVVLLTSTTWVG